MTSNPRESVGFGQLVKTACVVGCVRGVLYIRIRVCIYVYRYDMRMCTWVGLHGFMYVCMCEYVRVSVVYLCLYPVCV